MVFMSATQMLNLKLKNGDLCSITWRDQTSTAVAWLTAKADLKDGVIGVSRWLQDLCSIKLENKITVDKAQSILPDSSSIPIHVVMGEMPPGDVAGWTFVASTIIMGNHRYLVAGQRFFAVVDRQKKEFEVLSSKSSGHNIYKVTESSQVEIQSPEALTNGVEISPGIKFKDIGGLHRQKRLLKNIIREVSQPDLIKNWHTVTQNARGVILWGPPRTGKTMLRKAVESEISWTKVSEWTCSTAKSIPSSTNDPQLIHVRLHTKPSEQDSKALLSLLEAHTRSTLVLLEIQDPNDLPSFLRNEDTFADEIEVTIPDAPARSEILSLIARDSLDPKLLQIAASKTHGYVGGDLRRLVTETLRQASNDSLDSDEKHPLSTDPTPDHTLSPLPKPTTHHLNLSLSKIRPSALQQIFLETPTVHWTDIGGQTSLKRRLHNAVDRPLHHPHRLASYGISPTKGILLYGPPGCSKTMLVKALATESEYNFLAVKGAELLSMYVGESERATREVFRKARAASPCIVFFDEIDAIARRAGGSSSNGGGSDLNVLTTLLNELDGFEELRGVFVVAATNKPWSIDDALLRPGRFDNVVYVGPPDLETRAAIFSTTLSRTPKVSETLRGVLRGPMEGARVGFAERTEGFSGADIVAVCQRAGEIAFERAEGRGFGEGEGFVDGGGNEGSLEIEVDDVWAAIEGTSSSITAGSIREYEEWNVERGK